MSLKEVNHDLDEDQIVKTSERSIYYQNCDQQFENARNDNGKLSNSSLNTENFEQYIEQDEGECSVQIQTRFANIIEKQQCQKTQNDKKFFLKIFIGVLIFACFLSGMIISIPLILPNQYQRYSMKNNRQTKSNQFLKNRQKNGMVTIIQKQLLNPQQKGKVQFINFSKNNNYLTLGRPLVEQNQNPIAEKQKQLRTSENSQLPLQDDEKDKSLVKISVSNPSNHHDQTLQFTDLNPQQRRQKFETLQTYQQPQLPSRNINTHSRIPSVNFPYPEPPKPQESAFSSSMACSQYIFQEQQKHGKLYRFAVEQRLLQEYSKINYFAHQFTTKITYQKLSEAIDLLELTHHVDQDGNIVAQDNPCYSAEAFKKSMKELIRKQSKRLNDNYEIDSYYNRQLRFCLVVNNYNNVENGLIYRNIDSILQQNYTNYHVVYTDDNSPQLAGQKVIEYLKQKNITDSKFKVKINDKKVGMMENIYNAITYDCQKGEIAVMLDGDDSFIGTNVLSMLNALYQRQKVAMMWNNFLQIEQNSQIMMGFSQDIDEYQKNTERFRMANRFVSSHLKSFFVDLFRKIKPENLKYDDTKEFFGGASDTAMMFTMLELANPRFRYIPQIVYEYRFDTGQVGMFVNRDAQDKALRKVTMQKPYKKLQDFSFIQKAISQALTV